MTDDDTDHGRDVELAREASEPEDDEEDVDEEELTEEQLEARRRRQEEEARQDVEQASVERENDALEDQNPDHHRDEEPYNS